MPRTGPGTLGNFMKMILSALKAGLDIDIGARARIFQYTDGTIGARLASSLTSPSERATLAGLRRLLAWIDKETTP